MKFGRKTDFCPNCLDYADLRDGTPEPGAGHGGRFVIGILFIVVVGLIFVIFLRAQKLGIPLW